MVSLVQAISWPLVAVIAILFFGDAVKRLVASAENVTVKAGTSGIELGVERQKVEAIASLSAATARAEATEDAGHVVAAADASAVIRTVNEAVKPGTIVRLAGARVLWVDDHPENNEYPRRALEALGIRFDLSTSTEDALERLKRQRYDAIISDMGRPGDPHAGYTLLGRIRDVGISTPFIIYAGSNLPEHKAETVRRGGYGTTNNALELFSLVIGAIQTSTAQTSS